MKACCFSEQKSGKSGKKNKKKKRGINEIDLSHNDVKRGKPDVTRSFIGSARLTSQSNVVKHQAFHV